MARIMQDSRWMTDSLRTGNQSSQHATGIRCACSARGCACSACHDAAHSSEHRCFVDACSGRAPSHPHS
uniref:Metallothionein n=1 Tax=Setaria digitata TaxID=48799 RepID=A0A915PIX8_9BILA